jgi:hypothetical protein
MATTHFSGPVESANGFIGSVAGAVTTAPSSSVTASTLTVDSTYAGKITPLNRAAGIAVTLPAATGTGASYQFFIGTTVTSSATTIKVVGTDIMAGVAIVANDTDASASIFETASDTDTISFNGTTTGGVKGAMVTLVDVASGLWYVNITGSATGSEATPFSATV